MCWEPTSAQTVDLGWEPDGQCWPMKKTCGWRFDGLKRSDWSNKNLCLVRNLKFNSVPLLLNLYQNDIQLLLLLDLCLLFFVVPASLWLLIVLLVGASHFLAFSPFVHAAASLLSFLFWSFFGFSSSALLFMCCCCDSVIELWHRCRFCCVWFLFWSSTPLNANKWPNLCIKSWWLSTAAFDPEPRSCSIVSWVLSLCSLCSCFWGMIPWPSWEIWRPWLIVCTSKLANACGLLCVFAKVCASNIMSMSWKQTVALDHCSLAASNLVWSGRYSGTISNSPGSRRPQKGIKNWDAFVDFVIASATCRSVLSLTLCGLGAKALHWW